MNFLKDSVQSSFVQTFSSAVQFVWVFESGCMALMGKVVVGTKRNKCRFALLSIRMKKLLLFFLLELGIMLVSSSCVYLHRYTHGVSFQTFRQKKRTRQTCFWHGIVTSSQIITLHACTIYCGVAQQNMRLLLLLSVYISSILLK